MVLVRAATRYLLRLRAMAPLDNDVMGGVRSKRQRLEQEPEVVEH